MKAENYPIAVRGGKWNVAVSCIMLAVFITCVKDHDTLIAMVTIVVAALSIVRILCVRMILYRDHVYIRTWRCRSAEFRYEELILRDEHCNGIAGGGLITLYDTDRRYRITIDSYFTNYKLARRILQRRCIHE